MILNLYKLFVCLWRPHEVNPDGRGLGVAQVPPFAMGANRKTCQSRVNGTDHPGTVSEKTTRCLLTSCDHKRAGSLRVFPDSN